MNILFFNDTIDVGGGETWVISVAEKLRGRGHNVYVGCPTGSWLEKKAKSVDIECFTYLLRPEFTALLLWTAVSFVVEKQIDVIYCTILGKRKEAPLLAAILREAGRGIPNVIMEAMAMAKPVVAVNACGMPELVIDGETGLLVQPDSKWSLTEAILKLIRDKGKMEEMGRKGYLRVRGHFNRDEKVAEMEQFLQKELEESQKQERVRQIISLKDLGIPQEAPEQFFPRQCRLHLLHRPALRVQRIG